MADELSELAAAANDPALLAAEESGRPAFVVDVDGEIVWAGDAAFGLIGAGDLDPATLGTLARMARSGAGGLVRLRLGGLGAPKCAFRARSILIGCEPALLAMEALAPTAAAAPTPAVPIVEDVVVPRDVAAEEGTEPEAAEPEVVQPEHAAEPPAPEATAEGFAAGEALLDDRPPDPRRDLRGDALETLPGVPDLEPQSEAHSPEPDPADPDPAEGEHPEAETEFARAPLAAVPALRAEAAEPFRFAFEIDQGSRITLLSPELERAVGASAASAVGRPWGELAADLDLDPTGAVADALARSGAWSDLEVSWPVDDGRRLPLSLSALPMFDRGRSFVGFRGLGRSIGEPSAAQGAPRHVTEVVPEEVRAASADEDRAQSPDPQDAEAAAPPPVVPDTPRYEPPAIVEATLEAPVFAGNVVSLREASAPREPSPQGRGLSSSEESAFDEIARRLQGLGVRVAGREGDESLTHAQVGLEPAGAPEPERFLIEDQRELPFAAGAQELLRLIDRLPIGALVLRGGEAAHANRAALELFGCRDFGDLNGRGADALFAEALPQDRDAPAGAMRLIAANGGEVEVDARLSTIAWGGAPATLVTLRRPETSIAAARNFEQREREYAAVLDVATDGVLTLDGSGRILSVNRRAEALFGFEAREVLGSLFTLSLAPESRRAAFERLDNLKSEAATPDGGVEVLGLSRHGGALPLLLTVARIAEGDDDRFCAVFRDVGPWKRAEEELIAARRQADRANAQKSEFLAKVGHEIRTPLNAIIGFAEVMMEERLGPIGSARYKDYLRDIHTSGGHLVKMVDDLLDITRVETGKLKLDFVAVDLNEIASQATALLQPQANRDRVIIRTSLARGLPHVLADRRSIRQIMTNLAANAVKLSRPGGQVIVATSLGDAGQAVFRVRDAGAGMTKQEIARAFEPFRPLAVADNDTGFGLGLPLTRALAEANQAALALQSEVGQGTLAEVTFPASRVLAS